MNSKIYITQDDTEILDYITDSGIEHLDDNQDRVFTFLLDNSYNLVIYFSEEGDKGFILFKIEDIKKNMDEVSKLKGMLKELFVNTKENIIKIAIKQVEQIEVAGIAAEIFKTGKL